MLIEFSELFHKKSITFLILQLCVFIIFFIINIILINYKNSYYEGLPSRDNFCIVDAFYYTTATHTSIGFGDIIPRHRLVKLLSSVHMILVFILIVLEI